MEGGGDFRDGLASFNAAPRRPPPWARDITRLASPCGRVRKTKRFGAAFLYAYPLVNMFQKNIGLCVRNRGLGG
jgi:hypothetical protein